MVMIVLETMFPWVELEGVFVECANVSALPLTVQNLASSVDAFDSYLGYLEDNSFLEVGGGGSLYRNERRNQNRQNSGNSSSRNCGGGIVDIP